MARRQAVKNEASPVVEPGDPETARARMLERLNRLAMILLWLLSLTSFLAGFLFQQKLVGGGKDSEEVSSFFSHLSELLAIGALIITSTSVQSRLSRILEAQAKMEHSVSVIDSANGRLARIFEKNNEISERTVSILDGSASLRTLLNRSGIFENHLGNLLTSNWRENFNRIFHVDRDNYTEKFAEHLKFSRQWMAIHMGHPLFLAARPKGDFVIADNKEQLPSVTLKSPNPQLEMYFQYLSEHRKDGKRLDRIVILEDFDLEILFSSEKVYEQFWHQSGLVSNWVISRKKFMQSYSKFGRYLNSDEDCAIYDAADGKSKIFVRYDPELLTLAFDSKGVGEAFSDAGAVELEKVFEDIVGDMRPPPKFMLLTEWSSYDAGIDRRLKEAGFGPASASRVAGQFVGP